MKKGSSTNQHQLLICPWDSLGRPLQIHGEPRHSPALHCYQRGKDLHFSERASRPIACHKLQLAHSTLSMKVTETSSEISPVFFTWQATCPPAFHERSHRPTCPFSKRRHTPEWNYADNICWLYSVYSAYCSCIALFIEMSLITMYCIDYFYVLIYLLVIDWCIDWLVFAM